MGTYKTSKGDGELQPRIGSCDLNRAVREGQKVKKATYQRVFELGKGAIYVDIWGKAVQAERTASSKDQAGIFGE